MSLSTNSFYAHGKVLLSGEYFVLDEALALALPTRTGQTLQVEQVGATGQLQWLSFDKDGACWFEAIFDLPDLGLQESSDEAMGLRLATILQAAASQRPAGKWDPAAGLRLTTHLAFQRNWGLGSSSTLISLIAQWTNTDPFSLLEASFGGSGYDLACATARSPILYQQINGKPHFVEVPFDPPFKDQLYFVYLGQKQNSREGIARYRERVAKQPSLIEKINRLTLGFLCVKERTVFEELIHEHELLVAGALELPRAKEQHFPDFWGKVKSLGAWGGDFVLVSSARSRKETMDYFTGKNLRTVFPYRDLIIDIPPAS